MAEDLKDRPSYKNHAYNKMAMAWQILQDTCAGTLCLRENRAGYLPIEPAEDGRDFSTRISKAVFFNAVERTLHGLVGMVFRKEPKLSEDVPEVIRGREESEDQGRREGLVENIDNAGTHWTVFAKEAFMDAMRDGHSFIYVDMPPALPEGSTLADELISGRRPYWVSYCADQAVNWRVESYQGQMRLTQITFKECSYEPDGLYGEKKVTRYRVLTPGFWELWREVGNEYNAGSVTYVLEQSGPSSLSEIPIAIIYSRKLGHLMSKPPLLDLALINICHYQKYSDYSTYLHISSRPVLWFRGRNTDKKVEIIGPYTAFDVDAQNGMVDFAETTGAALGAARQDLIDLQEQMAMLGLSIVASKEPAPKTATEEVLDVVRESSDLATAARSLKDGLELALKFTVQYLTPTATTGGSVELGATIEELSIPPQELQTYSNMVATKQLSLDTLWNLMARAGKLPEDFDGEAEKERIDADAEIAMDRMLQEFERGEGMANLGERRNRNVGQAEGTKAA